MIEYRIHHSLPWILQTKEILDLIIEIKNYQKESYIDPYKDQAFEMWLETQKDPIFQSLIVQSIIRKIWDSLLC